MFRFSVVLLDCRGIRFVANSMAMILLDDLSVVMNYMPCRAIRYYVRANDQAHLPLGYLEIRQALKKEAPGNNPAPIAVNVQRLVRHFLLFIH